MIARLPAFRYMFNHYPQISLTIWTQDYSLELMEYLMPGNNHFTWRRYSEAPRALKRPIIEFDDTRLTTLQAHLTRHAFGILMDNLDPSREDLAYPRADLVSMDVISKATHDFLYFGKNPFIVFTTDYTAPARAWPAVHINRLARLVREAGLTPVLLGKTEAMKTGELRADGTSDDILPRPSDGLKTELFVDLRNKTSLIEALGVMQRAKAVLGLDNGLLHLAHCTDTPVVIGFSTLLPEHRVPVREIYGEYAMFPTVERGAQLTETIEAQVPCAGCQSRGFGITHDEMGNNIDWRKCPMKESRYACLLTLTADRFWEKLLKLGVVTKEIK